MLNRECDYFPCHKDLEDCTFCYCPFYPCNDIKTGGKLIFDKNFHIILDCSDCTWIHRTIIANEVFKQISRIKKSLLKKETK